MSNQACWQEGIVVEIKKFKVDGCAACEEMPVELDTPKECRGWRWGAVELFALAFGFFLGNDLFFKIMGALVLFAAFAFATGGNIFFGRRYWFYQGHIHRLVKRHWPWLEWEVKKGKPRVSSTFTGHALSLRNGTLRPGAKLYRVVNGQVVGMCPDWKVRQGHSVLRVTITDLKGNTITSDPFTILEHVEKYASLDAMDRSRDIVGREMVGELIEIERTKGRNPSKQAMRIHLSLRARLERWASAAEIERWFAEVQEDPTLALAPEVGEQPAIQSPVSTEAAASVA